MAFSLLLGPRHSHKKWAVLACSIASATSGLLNMLASPSSSLCSPRSNSNVWTLLLKRTWPTVVGKLLFRKAPRDFGAAQGESSTQGHGSECEGSALRTLSQPRNSSRTRQVSAPECSKTCPPQIRINQPFCHRTSIRLDITR